MYSYSEFDPKNCPGDASTTVDKKCIQNEEPEAQLLNATYGAAPGTQSNCTRKGTVYAVRNKSYADAWTSANTQKQATRFALSGYSR